MASADEPDRSADRADDGDDRDAIDRAFADLVAGYHLTAERPELPSRAETLDRRDLTERADADPESPSTGSWADDHPLFRYEPEPVPDPAPEPEERYVPTEPEPLPKPAWPVLLAWIGMGYAILMLLGVVVGVRLPAWAGWLAIIGFVGGFGILVTRLPRDRPPGSGDGAVI